MPIPAIGEAAPWFSARTPSCQDFQFSAAGGRYVLLSFIGSAASEQMRAMLAQLGQRHDLFNDNFASHFVISCDPADEASGRLSERPGQYVFWDTGGAVTRLYGLGQPAPSDKLTIMQASLVLDPMLRVLAILPLQDPGRHAEQIVTLLAGLPPHPPGGANMATAPVLIVPRIFEPAFCRDLIALFDPEKSLDSGFMRNDPVTGNTVYVHDHALKRRRDVEIADTAMQDAIRVRLKRRIVPEVRRAFHFEATRIERYIVARYDGADGSHFRPHRDNTTKGTAHRRFAVTLNLNAEDYDGGDLVFPEYDRRTYRAPTGGAVVFSCSLLHEARPVTRGVRYCFLPFLYDEAAANIRAQNQSFVTPRAQMQKTEG
jgi:hypothetical protein